MKTNWSNRRTNKILALVHELYIFRPKQVWVEDCFASMLGDDGNFVHFGKKADDFNLSYVAGTR